MKKADRATAEALRAQIRESTDRADWPTEGGQITVIFPDSPYGPVRISVEVIAEAVHGLPDVYAFARFTATDAVPFDGWQIVCRRGAAA